MARRASEAQEKRLAVQCVGNKAQLAQGALRAELLQQLRDLAAGDVGPIQLEHFELSVRARGLDQSGDL